MKTAMVDSVLNLFIMGTSFFSASAFSTVFLLVSFCTILTLCFIMFRSLFHYVRFLLLCFCLFCIVFFIFVYYVQFLLFCFCSFYFVFFFQVSLCTILTLRFIMYRSLFRYVQFLLLCFCVFCLVFFFVSCHYFSLHDVRQGSVYIVIHLCIDWVFIQFCTDADKTINHPYF